MNDQTKNHQPKNDPARAGGLLKDFLRRLRLKVLGMIPIIVAAIALTAILSLAVYVASPLLPDAYRDLLHDVQTGDWEGSRDRLSQLFDGFGAAKPIAFLAMQVAQVLFAPIPGQAVGLIGGYLFGFWYGLALTMIGLGIGTWIAIGLGRLLGERLVRKVVPPKVLEKFDYLITEGGLWNFFLLFLLPALPDDAICFIAGLTRLSIWRLLATCLLGRLPGMAVLLFVGSSVGGSMTIANIVLVIATLAAVGLWLYSDEVEAYFARLVKKTEEDAQGSK